MMPSQWGILHEDTLSVSKEFALTSLLIGSRRLAQKAYIIVGYRHGVAGHSLQKTPLGVLRELW